MSSSGISLTWVFINTLSERLSQEGTLISPGRVSSRAMSPVLDLERRLATDHTLDIFTMQLKVRAAACARC